MRSQITTLGKLMLDRWQKDSEGASPEEILEIDERIYESAVGHDDEISSDVAKNWERIIFLDKVGLRARAAAANNWELADKIDAEISSMVEKYCAIDEVAKICQESWELASKCRPQSVN